MSLEKNRVTAHDFKNIFSEEEMHMIKDLEYLRKNYPKYF